MTYRTAGRLCPSCTNAPLREFQGRLVCDECGGMMIGADDFAASLRELDGAADGIVLSDEQPIGKACPACERELAWCVATYGQVELGKAFQRCTQHGLWVTRDAMTAIFARVSRRANRAHGGMTAGGAAPPNTGSGLGGAMRSIGQAFGGGPATSGLRIGQWSSARPRVHTLYVSAHKERRLGCPSCDDTALEYAGDRWPCSTCSGVFVENAALAAMVQEMRNAPWEVPVVLGAPGERVCPICREAMLVEVLEAVTVDRCAHHGVWFDANELADALHHASAILPGDEPSGLGGWLRRLFHRHGQIQG